MLKLIVSAIREKRPLIKKETLSFEARGLSLGVLILYHVLGLFLKNVRFYSLLRFGM